MNSTPSSTFPKQAALDLVDTIGNENPYIQIDERNFSNFLEIQKKGARDKKGNRVSMYHNYYLGKDCKFCSDTELEFVFSELFNDAMSSKSIMLITPGNRSNGEQIIKLQELVSLLDYDKISFSIKYLMPGDTFGVVGLSLIYDGEIIGSNSTSFTKIKDEESLRKAFVFSVATKNNILLYLESALTNALIDAHRPR